MPARCAAGRDLHSAAAPVPTLLGVHPIARHLRVYGASATSGPVTVRVPDLDELAALADAVAAGGLDDEQTRLALGPWVLGTRDEGAERVANHVLASVSGIEAGSWVLPMAVFHDGRPVGMQTAKANGFLASPVVTTGSWLLNTHRRQGLGVHARAAVLEVIFELGAAAAETSWVADNAASAGVSGKLGYRITGRFQRPNEYRGADVDVVDAEVDADAFHDAWTAPIRLEGVHALSYLTTQ